MVHPEDPLSTLDQTLAALADPTRRGVVDLLRQKPRRAGELASALDMSPPAMSRHLRVLRKTGLIGEDSPEHDARVRVYHLRPEPFSALSTWLEEVQGFWTSQLDSFAAHIVKAKSGNAVGEAAARGPGRGPRPL